MIFVNDKEVKIEHFLSGEQRINNVDFIEKDNEYYDNEFYSYNVCWKYDNDEELVSLIYICEHIKENNGILLNLYMPYIPNARMDRVYNKEKEIFTLKYFTKIINNLGFKRVIVENPHSDVSISLLNNVYVDNQVFIEDIERTLKDIDSKNILLFYPDAGAMKRYNKILDKDFLYAEKIRNWHTGEIEDLKIIGEIPKENFDVLIIDDICSKGGTFYYSAKKLKEFGVNNIYLYISHCENSILEGEFGKEKVNLLETDLIKKVYTTTSIFRKSDNKIHIL